MPAETKVEYANHPATIAVDLINAHLRFRPTTDIQNPANKFFAQFIKGGESEELALERFVKPIDVFGIPLKDRELMEKLMGRQSFALASLVHLNSEFPKVKDFATSAATRERFRLLLDKTLLNDFAFLQHEADEATSYNNLIFAAEFQRRADQMLEFRKELLAKANPTEEAPGPGQ